MAGLKKIGPRRKSKRNKHVLTIEELFSLQKGRCYYCRAPMLLGPAYFGSLRQATIDHVVPKIKGGKNIGNRVICCSECNMRKGTKSLAEFRKELKDE